MEVLRYARDEELSFRFLGGNHLIYRFVYEHDGIFRLIRYKVLDI